MNYKEYYSYDQFSLKILTNLNNYKFSSFLNLLIGFKIINKYNKELKIEIQSDFKYQFDK